MDCELGETAKHYREKEKNIIINSGLDPGWDGCPGDDGDDEGRAGCLVVGADEDHDQGHQLHAPGYQVESPVVRWRSHPIDDTKTDEARYQDVADH